MIIKRSREHVVNLSHYESVRVGGSIEFSGQDVADLQQQGLDPLAVINQKLDALLESDLEEAAANVPQDQPTHLDTWRK